MNIEIKIDCETEQELLSHLYVVRQKIKREIKKQGGGIKVPFDADDNNCCGHHTIIVIPDCESEHFPDGNGFCLSCGKQLGVKFGVEIV